MTSAAPVVETTFTDLKLLKRGKVRDVYEVDSDRLLIVATDRISAFDSVSPTPIERKGEVLTALSRFWFGKLADIVPNHLITTNIINHIQRMKNTSKICSQKSQKRNGPLQLKIFLYKKQLVPLKLVMSILNILALKLNIF